MKKAEAGSTYFFVDESGDPTFYDRRGNLIVGSSGCSPLLILGLVKIQDPISVRKNITQLKQPSLVIHFLQIFLQSKRRRLLFTQKMICQKSVFYFLKKFRRWNSKPNLLLREKLSEFSRIISPQTKINFMTILSLNYLCQNYICMSKISFTLQNEVPAIDKFLLKKQLQRVLQILKINGTSKSPQKRLYKRNPLRENLAFP